jgi:1-acyl-sn-glycerol-3-phosphate acyltransferase
MNIAEPQYRAFYADVVPGREPNVRAYGLAVCAGTIMTVGAAAMLVVAIFTGFRARVLYARCATALSRVVLRLYQIRIHVHGAPSWPSRQTVYISNHTSTLDLFVLVALGLPNTRFFLSGFLRRIVPLGVISWLMGTFYTVPQSRSAERTRIFRRATEVLRRTGASVYQSPEGGRITTGTIGHFNKGAFHLAMDLRAPIVPMFICIPPEVDPRRGFDARPGEVDVYVLDAVETSAWRYEDLIANKERIRETFVRFSRDRLRVDREATNQGRGHEADGRGRL